MRITFVMSGGFSLAGGDRVIAIYAQKLSDRGHTVNVVARPRKALTIRERLRYVRRHRALPPSNKTIPSHFDGLSVPHTRVATYRPIVDSDLPDADVVIATWWETAEWVQRLSLNKGRKFYFLQGYEAFDGIPKERVDATWRLPFKKIVVSSWLQRLAAEKFLDTSAVLVPNSVDQMQFGAPQRGKQDIPTIGTLQHSHPIKGVPDAAEAIRRVAAHFQGLRAITFGEGEFTERLPSNVELVHYKRPEQSNLKHIYSACDVWLSASRNEGFGLTSLEAMACRCPVVSTRSGGPEDFVVPGRNGFLADVGDVSSLANHLVEVLQLSEGDWCALSEASFATATEYNWDEAATLMEAALLSDS